MSRRGSVVIAALFFALLGSVGAAAAQTAQGQAQTGQRALRREAVVETISGFSVVLVLGETQPSGSAATDTLPAGAKKALSDMREFLPYKNYRVLDTQWTSCCGPKSTTTVSGRLQGVVANPAPNGVVNLGPRQYAFSISASLSNANIPVRFVLAVEDSTTRSPERADRSRELERERQDLQAEIESLRVQVAETQKRVDVGVVSATELRPLQDRLASMQRRLTDLTAYIENPAHGGARPIIDSSFTMDAGETVVVGTSKLGGDKALIAVVTAVKKAGAPKE